jgi:DNA repair ATPase RecN
MKKSAVSRKKVMTIEGLADLFQKRMGGIDGKLAELDDRFDSVDSHIERLAVNMATEFERVDIRLDGIDTRLVAVEEGLRGLRRDIYALDKRITELEESIQDIRGYAKEIDALRSEMKLLKARLDKYEKIQAAR